MKGAGKRAQQSKDTVSTVSTISNVASVDSIKVLIRENANSAFCIECDATLDVSSSTYIVQKNNGETTTLNKCDVFPILPNLHPYASSSSSSSSSGSGGGGGGGGGSGSGSGGSLQNDIQNDVGREIAVFYSPEHRWYCGTVERAVQHSQPSSHTQGTTTSTTRQQLKLADFHVVRYEINGQIEKVDLDKEEYVWLS